MTRAVSSPFIVGPRFAFPVPGASSQSPFARQLVRAVRSLIGQRGGVMLLRSWDSGADVRIECSFDGTSVSVVLLSAHDETAGALRAHAARIGRECSRSRGGSRRGQQVQVSCLGPVPQPLVPAA
jgi:hypothetical protein